MTAQISAYGRLVADPQTRTTGKGTSMAMARLAVSLPCNASDNGEAIFWLGVIAFGKQADALAIERHLELTMPGKMRIRGSQTCYLHLIPCPTWSENLSTGSGSIGCGMPLRAN